MNFDGVIKTVTAFLIAKRVLSPKEISFRSDLGHWECKINAPFGTGTVAFLDGKYIEVQYALINGEGDGLANFDDCEKALAFIERKLIAGERLLPSKTASQPSSTCAEDTKVGVSINLTDLIEDLVASLAAQGFNSGYNCREIVEESSKQSVSDTYPALLFLEWASRCPQARSWLARHGLPVDRPIEQLQPLWKASREEKLEPAAKLTVTPRDRLKPGMFYATIGDDLMIVKLIEKVGEILKVEIINDVNDLTVGGTRIDIHASQVPGSLRPFLDLAVRTVGDREAFFKSEGGQDESGEGESAVAEENGHDQPPPY